MEGVYRFNAGTLSDDFIRNLYGEKSKHAICSFSGERAFSNPLMWGYYANGFRGIAIEVEVNGDEANITKVNYASEVANITNGERTGDAVNRILTTKLCCWSHEDEYRYLHKGGAGRRKIGKITGVYFGNPYRNVVNKEDVKKNDSIRKYVRRVKSLKQTAERKGRDCLHVTVENGQVTRSTEDAKA